jgi:hypothetical protein
MKTLLAMAVATVSVLTNGVSFEQSTNMMNGGTWSVGWLDGRLRRNRAVDSAGYWLSLLARGRLSDALAHFFDAHRATQDIGWRIDWRVQHAGLKAEGFALSQLHQASNAADFETRDSTWKPTRMI